MFSEIFFIDVIYIESKDKNNKFCLFIEFSSKTLSLVYIKFSLKKNKGIIRIISIGGGGKKISIEIRISKKISSLTIIKNKLI